MLESYAKAGVVGISLVVLGIWVFPTKARHANISPTSVCQLLPMHPGWQAAIQHAHHHWAVSPGEILAIIQIESEFKPQAMPASFPWLQSSALGYAQALQGTWQQYLHARGLSAASRTSFYWSVDFIGWYVTQLRLRASRPLSSYDIYIGYHEGVGALLHKHRINSWLDHKASKFSLLARTYDQALSNC